MRLDDERRGAGPRRGRRPGEVDGPEVVGEALQGVGWVERDRLVLGRGAVLTPLGRDRARASGVQIEKER